LAFDPLMLKLRDDPRHAQQLAAITLQD